MQLQFNRSIRILSLAIAAVIMLIISFSAFFSIFYEKALIRYLKTYLDERLLTEISVGEIRFKILKGFPHATVELRNVTMLSGRDFSTVDFHGTFADTLLTARRISCQFDLIGLLHRRYELRKIDATDGYLNILTDNSSINNLNIWKTPENKEHRSYSVNLNAIHLNDMYIRINNLPEKVFWLAMSTKTTLRGTFSDDGFSGEIRGDASAADLIIREKTLLNNAALQLQAKMIYAERHFRIRQGKIQVNKAVIQLSGSYGMKNDRPLNITLVIPRFGLEELISILPVSSTRSISAYHFDGKGKFTGRLHGYLKGNRGMNVTGNFSLNDCSARNNFTRTSLDKINLSGSISGNTENDIRLDITQFSASLGKGKISGDLILFDLHTMPFKANIAANLDLKAFSHFINADTIEDLSGFIQSEIHTEGQLKPSDNESASSYLDFLKNGHFTFNDAGISIKKGKYRLQHMNGRATLNRIIQLDSLSFQLNNNEFLLSGSLDNLAGYLLKNGELSVRLNMETGSFDLIKFLVTTKNQSKSAASKDTDFFPDRIRLQAKFSSDKFIAGKFHATDLKLSMLLFDDSAFINRFVFKFPDGGISGNALVVEDTSHIISVSCNTKSESVNIQQLFTSFNNFAQHFIVDRNVNGELNGDIGFYAQWDADMKFMKESLEARANITISDGELVQFEPMLRLSKYINVDELSHIRFSTLKNEIFINNQQVTIPEMAIHSSAFNISVSGQHSFDNHFVYKLRVLLSEVLFNKARKKKREISEFMVEEQRADQTTIPLIISGTPDNYEVKFDRKRAFDLTRKSSVSDEGVDTPAHFKVDWNENQGKASSSKKEPDKTDASGFKIIWEEAEDTTKSEF
jgi:hypothetical protein